MRADAWWLNPRSSAVSTSDMLAASSDGPWPVAKVALMRSTVFSITTIQGADAERQGQSLIETTVDR